MGLYAQSGTHDEVGLKSIGELLIKEAFRLAYYGQTHSMMTIEVEQAVLFINGSSLERAITTFGLGYNPTRLRETFVRWASA